VRKEPIVSGTGDQRQGDLSPMMVHIFRDKKPYSYRVVVVVLALRLVRCIGSNDLDKRLLNYWKLINLVGDLDCREVLL